MSSINIDNNVVLAGFTDPNFLYAINADTGAVLWKQTVAGVANTGMGDNSPTVDSQSHVVFQNSIVDGDPATKTVDSEVFATDIATGALSWQTKLGRGPNPPAYKAGVGMVHNGVLYLGSPNTSIFHALDEKTGKEMWAFHIPGAGPAGAGRGAAAFYHGVVWLAAGPSLYALDPKTGSVLGKNTPGGRFGIVNPVIVGSTMYLGNSWGWIQAVPLDTIYSGWRNQT
jgi:outer membrane protein assembly factor BamB